MDREAIIKLVSSLITELNSAKEKLSKVELSNTDMLGACKFGVEEIEKIVAEMENDLINSEKTPIASQVTGMFICWNYRLQDIMAKINYFLVEYMGKLDSFDDSMTLTNSVDDVSNLSRKFVKISEYFNDLVKSKTG